MLLKPKRHKFRDKMWHLRWRRPRRDKEDIEKDLWPIGRCNPFTDTVTISPHEPPWKLFEAMLHEGIHACHFDLDEPAVNSTTLSLIGLFRKSGMKISFD